MFSLLKIDLKILWLKQRTNEAHLIFQKVSSVMSSDSSYAVRLSKERTVLFVVFCNSDHSFWALHLIKYWLYK